MKRKNLYSILMVLAFILLSGCTGETTNSAMDEMDEAIQNNLTLDNAVFVRELEVNAEEDKMVMDAEGVFISLDDETYNWSHKEFTGSEENYTHTVHIDGETYIQHGFSDARTSEWTEVDEENYALNRFIQPLFENTLDEATIAEVEVTEADETTYVIHLNDTYIEQFVAASVEDLEAAIEDIQHVEGGMVRVRALESQIERIQEREYADPSIEMTINNEGYLVKHMSAYTYTEQDAEPVRVTTTYEITDYNIEDAEALFPEI